MAAYEDIEDAGADQFAKGNPVRGGLWIAYGVAWNAFSFGSLEKNSALVEKYKGGKISSEACDKGMAINSVKSGVQLAITATGAGALRGGLAATEIIKDAAIVGVTQATTASVEVGADRTVSHVTGQPYTKSTAQDNTYIACNGLYGFTFGCYGSGFGQLGGYYGGRFANYTSRLTLLPKPPPVPGNIDDYIKALPSRKTPTNTPANQFEIRHTGDMNYRVSGGGETFDIDGYSGTTILEAKHVGTPARSPFVPDSAAPDFIRRGILNNVDDEFRRMRAIIDDPANPFLDVEVITNDPRAADLFRKMMQSRGLKPNVKLGE